MEDTTLVLRASAKACRGLIEAWRQSRAVSEVLNLGKLRSKRHIVYTGLSYGEAELASVARWRQSIVL